ncbi:MAG: SpoIIE family protein phosphatase [Proteobacteria bacterium]|nr:SpoIIE family protein phosphatase [Pseudomonadota bacterium]
MRLKAFGSSSFLTTGVIGLSVVVFALFYNHIRHQWSSHAYQNELVEKGHIYVLNNWNMTVEICPSYALKGCRYVSDYANVSLHGPESTRAIFSKLRKEQGFVSSAVWKATFSQVIDENISEWLSGQKVTDHHAVQLMIPQFHARFGRVLLPQKSLWQELEERDFYAPLGDYSADGKNVIRFQAAISVADEWLGSRVIEDRGGGDSVLVRSESVYEYSAVHKVDNHFIQLQRNIVVLLPVVVAFLALILDHMMMFLLVAYVSLFYAVGSLLNAFQHYLRAQTPHSPIGQWALDNDVLDYPLLIMYALIAVFFLRIACYLVLIKPRKWFWLAISGAAIAVNFVLHRYNEFYMATADLWNDLVGLLLGSVGVMCGLVMSSRKRRLIADQEELFSMSDGWRRAGFMVAGMIFMVTILAIVVDLGGQSADIKRYVTWGHSLMIPGLLVLALTYVGSIMGTIRRVSGIFGEKATLDRDIEIGRQLQSGLLPKKKHRTDLYRWHAFYYPADQLAGDWYDLKQITSADGRALLVGCIVDVTGHGIPSAMMTSNIASHWSLWVDSIKETELSLDHQQREVLLASAPRQVHRGLVGLRYNLGCSMAAFIYEPLTRIFTYVTAGHPGLIISSGHSFRYFVSKKGSRPGLESDHVAWQAHSLTLSDDPQYLCLYTDGLLESGTAMGTWLKRLQRQSSRGKKSPMHFLINQMRDNRRFFLKHPEKEDDITVIVVGIMWQSSS